MAWEKMANRMRVAGKNFLDDMNDKQGAGGEEGVFCRLGSSCTEGST